MATDVPDSEVSFIRIQVIYRRYYKGLRYRTSKKKVIYTYICMYAYIYIYIYIYIYAYINILL
jgi:hypothetical protein